MTTTRYLESVNEVWCAQSKGGFTLFNSKDSADLYVSQFPASIGGGLHVTKLPVFSVSRKDSCPMAAQHKKENSK
jgi:hypothetical protein